MVEKGSEGENRVSVLPGKRKGQVKKTFTCDRLKKKNTTEEIPARPSSSIEKKGKRGDP